MSKQVKLAALGSSFAAGPGIEPVENADAMRSSRNYAHQLAEILGAELVDLTVSGATTTTVVETPQITMAGVEFAPQIDGLPADADLVMVTAGGNDLQYAGSMLYAAWSRLQPESPILAMLSQGQPDGILEPTDQDVEAVARGLVEIVETARPRGACPGGVGGLPDRHRWPAWNRGVAVLGRGRPRSAASRTLSSVGARSRRNARGRIS